MGAANWKAKTAPCSQTRRPGRIEIQTAQPRPGLAGDRQTCVHGFIHRPIFERRIELIAADDQRIRVVTTTTGESPEKNFQGGPYLPIALNSVGERAAPSGFPAQKKCKGAAMTKSRPMSQPQRVAADFHSRRRRTRANAMAGIGRRWGVQMVMRTTARGIQIQCNRRRRVY